MIAQPPLLARRGDALRVFLLTCLLLFPALAFADYRTYEIESLRITVDTDWPSVGTVGYFPIRLDITNLAEDAREIEVAVSINHYFDPSRRRGAAGVRTSFSRADMGRSDVRQRVALKRGDRKRFTLPIPVLADSERITLAFREDGRNLDSSTAFTFQSGRTLPETPLVVVSSASSTLAATVGLRPMVVYRPSYMSPSPVPASGVTPKMDIALDPSRLPRNWLGYTALRAVLLGPTEWKELEPDQQDALLMWTAVGGDLIFADGSLDMLLPPGQTPVGLKKTDAVPWYFGNIHLLKSADIREKGLVDTISFLDSAVATPDWSLPTIRSSDWGWMGARNFRVPIEGVGYVPIRQYLLILALFVALIGPINYIYLWRRGRQVLLVLTVPLISAAFILLLTGYGVLSQGFDVRARAVTFTVLDQNAKKAATRASVSLFPGGISRSSGVRFASDTGVISLGNDGLGARELTLDLTGEQRYTSGFLRPRTPGNFEQVWFQPARQRLNFERNGDQVSVVNGLGTTLKQLYYLEGGAVTYALDRPLAAGEQASMKTSDQSMPGLVNAIRDGIKETPISPGKFQHVLTYRPEGAYLAVLEASPFWEPGLEKPREIGSLHVVLGFAGGQP